MSAYREAGISTFLWGDKLAAYNQIPFVYRPDWPPLPPTGLQIDRSDDGAWRTYQARFPDSTLTSGHADNIEAFWALHAMRNLATWATTIDVRVEVDGPEVAHAEIERESIAGKADAVNERYAQWRSGPQTTPPDVIEPVKGSGGLAVGRIARDGERPSDWAVLIEADGSNLTGYCVGSKTRARAAAKEIGALTDWPSLPPYVAGAMSSLEKALREIRYRAAVPNPEKYGLPVGGAA